MSEYTEPVLAVLVLDYLKEVETRASLGSIKSHVKIPHKVIYSHNGMADYPTQLFKEGLIDHFIQTRVNGGLGLGTRDLFAAAFSPYCLYLQNDQQLTRDITPELIRHLVALLDTQGEDTPLTIKSVSLAGPVGGDGVYSERAHFIRTSFYQDMERAGVLGYGGAGPYHDVTWRERQIQDYYRLKGYTHFNRLAPFVQDNGHDAVRLNPDGSRWRHRTDTKELKLESGPVKERYVYPYLTDAEWAGVLATQSWPDWQIPEKERASSFKVWNR